jgi:2-oxoisovalerate dehydrogenase E1 component
VYWAKTAAADFPGSVEIIDLRTLNPLDFKLLLEAVQRHGKALVLTEEPLLNSFAESLAGRLMQHCFRYLDAPIATVGAANLPAVPLNIEMEKSMLPDANKVSQAIRELLNF